MKQIFIDQMIEYNGTQLRSSWIHDVTKLDGDAIVAFVGKADVPIEHMVDLEDVAANAPIYSEAMLHFIVEMFDTDLEKMVLRQRLLMAIMHEEIYKYPPCKNVRRAGDDLYDGEAKLSVSIATHSPHSCLIHSGINISSRNTPLATKGLSDYEISPKPFAFAIMKRFCEELKEIAHATTKVRPVA